MKLGRKTSRRDQRQRVSPNEVDAMLKLDESGDMIGLCHDTPENRERLVHKNFLMVEKDPYSS